MSGFESPLLPPKRLSKGGGDTHVPIPVLLAPLPVSSSRSLFSCHRSGGLRRSDRVVSSRLASFAPSLTKPSTSVRPSVVRGINHLEFVTSRSLSLSRARRTPP